MNFFTPSGVTAILQDPDLPVDTNYADRCRASDHPDLTQTRRIFFSGVFAMNGNPQALSMVQEAVPIAAGEW